MSEHKHDSSFVIRSFVIQVIRSEDVAMATVINITFRMDSSL